MALLEAQHAFVVCKTISATSSLALFGALTFSVDHIVDDWSAAGRDVPGRDATGNQWLSKKLSELRLESSRLRIRRLVLMFRWYGTFLIGTRSHINTCIKAIEVENSPQRNIGVQLDVHGFSSFLQPVLLVVLLLHLMLHGVDLFCELYPLFEPVEEIQLNSHIGYLLFLCTPK